MLEITIMQHCRDEVFSAFEELDWRGMLSWADSMAAITGSKTIRTYTELVRHLEDKSYLPQQQVLFSLPFYYYGK